MGHIDIGWSDMATSGERNSISVQCIDPIAEAIFRVNASIRTLFALSVGATSRRAGFALAALFPLAGRAVLRRSPDLRRRRLHERAAAAAPDGLRCGYDLAAADELDPGRCADLR